MPDNRFLTKPFSRIMRPQLGGEWYGDYIYDRRYSDSWSSSIRALDLIINDFRRLCEFVDPRDENITTHSHRIYELCFRACSEFESNCRQMLHANGYQKGGSGGKIVNPKYWNITDYVKLNTPCLLEKYVINFPFWNDGGGLDLTPFKNLSATRSGVLDWYRTYSRLKHEREYRFSNASLENLMNALASLVTILFAQYGMQVFDPYQRMGVYEYKDDLLYVPGSIFGIRPPNFEKEERYNLDWSELKAQESPFMQFVL